MTELGLNAFQAEDVRALVDGKGLRCAKLKRHVLSSSLSAVVETAKMTGDETADAESLKAFGTIDAAIDFTPPKEQARVT